MEPRPVLEGLAEHIAAAGLGVYRGPDAVYTDAERPVFPNGALPTRGEHISLLAGEFVRGSGRGAGVLPVQLFIRVKGDRLDVAESASALRRLFERRAIQPLGISDVTFASGGFLGTNTTGMSEHSLNLRFLGRRPM